MKYPLVSIIIPTKNSGLFLEQTLKSIKKQSYNDIETIIVDGKSTDNTLSLAKKYHVNVYSYIPQVPKGTFDAPHKRNYGVKKAKGKYVYYVDADMELTKDVVQEAVAKGEAGYDAITVSEDSFGEGIWAQAKNLERRCYWGDATIEAPRFFRKSVWEKVGGLDESLGGGGDDWDLFQKVVKAGYKAGRIKALVLHNEGKLNLYKLARKRFMYGRDTARYLLKRPLEGSKSYFPIRKGFIKNWKMFVKRPKDTIAFITMRTIEYCAGFSGIIYSLITK